MRTVTYQNAKLHFLDDHLMQTVTIEHAKYHFCWFESLSRGFLLFPTLFCGVSPLLNSIFTSPCCD
jgi:hypothetical protein